MSMLVSWKKFSAPIIFVLLIAFHTEISRSEVNFVNVDEFMEDLKTRNIDLILDDLNKMKRMRYRGNILPVLQNLWDERQDLYPDLPWEIVKSNVIRIEIANVILQAYRNHELRVDINNFSQFSLDQAKSEDLRVVLVAAMNLAIVDSDEAVSTLLDVAKRMEPGTFRAAVISLSRMCNPKSRDALEELEKSISVQDMKSYVIEARLRSEGIRQNLCRH